MPIPSPRKGQSQEDFMKFCMGSEVMTKEFPEQKQRVAVCLSKWKEAHKGSESSNLETENQLLKIIESFLEKHPELNKGDNNG